MCKWVSILKNGLLLDPSKIGAVITGKMFGYGFIGLNSFLRVPSVGRALWRTE